MKILIIRFSSIGDIVLTTPVVRCIKQQLKAEVHFLTKKNFLPVLDQNPYIDKIHLIDNKVSEAVEDLKAENFDFVVDLHHNLRSLQVKNALGKKSAAFNKLNIKKWLLVNFKVNKLPSVHIVDRYLETVKALGVKNDQQGLDFFISSADQFEVTVLPVQFQQGFYSLVLGGNYFTKQIPTAKIREIIQLSDKPLVLLGGKAEAEQGRRVQEEFKEKVVDLCGQLSLGQSASVIQQSQKVITSDTGLMHIAAAFKKDIVSFWGNTIPEFGMSPYMAGAGSKILEVKNLGCRPCSKLGYRKCPRGHFKCMNEIKIEL